MHVGETVSKLNIYVDEKDKHHHKPVYEAVLDILHDNNIAGASVFRGTAGYGADGVMHSAKILELSTDLPVKIEAHATVRETDGLALSSRNAYLRGEDRQAATILFRALCTARDAIETGERSAATITKIMYSVLESEPRLRIDYAAVVDAETFQPLDPLSGRIVLPVAGSIAGTRLLDNIRIDLND